MLLGRLDLPVGMTIEFFANESSTPVGKRVPFMEKGTLVSGTKSALGTRGTGEAGCEGFKSLRENWSWKGTASRAAEKLCFVSGHDFSRAVNDLEYDGL